MNEQKPPHLGVMPAAGQTVGPLHASVLQQHANGVERHDSRQEDPEQDTPVFVKISPGNGSLFDFGN